MKGGQMVKSKKRTKSLHPNAKSLNIGREKNIPVTLWRKIKMKKKNGEDKLYA